MRDLIDRQGAINAFRNANLNIMQGNAVIGRRSYMTPKEAVKIIENLPSAQPVDKDINVPTNDHISRQAVIDVEDGK